MMKPRVDTLRFPTAEPVSLSMAKNHLRIDSADEDVKLTSLITAARTVIEDWTGRFMCLREVQVFYHSAPYWPVHIDPVPRAGAVAVTYLDSAGVEQIWAPNEYETTGRDGTYLLPATGYSFPTVKQGLEVFRVRLPVGYATPVAFDSASDTVTAPWHPFSDGDRVFLTGHDEAVAPTGLVSKAFKPYFVINATDTSFQLEELPGGGAVDFTTDGSGQMFLGEPIPHSMISAMLLMIGHLYENREPVVVGTTSSELPFTVRSLLNPYRVWRL